LIEQTSDRRDVEEAGEQDQLDCDAEDQQVIRRPADLAGPVSRAAAGECIGRLTDDDRRECRARRGGERGAAGERLTWSPSGRGE